MVLELNECEMGCSICAITLGTYWLVQTLMVNDKLLVLLPRRDEIIRDSVEDLSEDLRLREPVRKVHLQAH